MGILCSPSWIVQRLLHSTYLSCSEQEWTLLLSVLRICQMLLQRFHIELQPRGLPPEFPQRNLLLREAELSKKRKRRISQLLGIFTLHLLQKVTLELHLL